MAVEAPVSKQHSATASRQTTIPATIYGSAASGNSIAGKKIAIDAPTAKPASLSLAARLRDAEEDLARLQDQLMDVLEENQQLRAELEAWRIGARAFTQQNRAS